MVPVANVLFFAFRRYLTVEYLLADLLQRSYNSNREATLMTALQNYERFLTRLYHYDILNDKDKKLYERYTANPRSFTLVLANDAAARRETKINRFREEKELKQKLEVGCLLDRDWKAKSSLTFSSIYPIIKVPSKATTMTFDGSTSPRSICTSTKHSRRWISSPKN